MTAVAGHLTSNDFEDQYRKWHSCDPVQLFDAGVKTYVTQVSRVAQPSFEVEAPSLIRKPPLRTPTTAASRRICSPKPRKLPT